MRNNQLETRLARQLDPGGQVLVVDGDAAHRALLRQILGFGACPVVADARAEIPPLVPATVGG